MIKGYKKIDWTEHSKFKMRQYGLSKSKLINLLYKPQRKESGIVPGTTAVMKTNKSYANIRKPITNKLNLKYSPIKKSSGEIWLMYQDIKNKNIRKIISAWRYPGISKPGEIVDIIPEDIRQELLNNYGK